MAEQLSLIHEPKRVRCVVIGSADRLDITTKTTAYLGCVVHGAGGVMHGDAPRTLARVRRMVEGKGPDARDWDGVVRVYTLHTPARDAFEDVRVEDIVDVRLTGAGGDHG